MHKLLQGVAPLTHFGLIRAQGVDAAQFLHNQLTQDVVQLGMDRARLAGLCNARGRLLASFIAVKRAADDVLLVCSRDILPATLKRLSLFVLRAKLRLSDASADFTLYGLAGQALIDASTSGADGPYAAWSRHDFDSAILVHLYPADGVARALWLAPADQRAPAGPALDSAWWAWSEVRAGVATVSQPIVEACVPQMLNYESVGGVSFKKGCYPGQEVVARSQFRGTLKRRTYLAHAAAPLQAGQELFTADDAEQPCGLVVQAAPAPGGAWDALVCLQISAFEAAQVRTGGPAGALLNLSPPPYPLLADV